MISENLEKLTDFNFEDLFWKVCRVNPQIDKNKFKTFF